MNLVELYSQTPVDKHENIKAAGDRVLVKQGGVKLSNTWLSEPDGELWLMPSPIKTVTAGVEGLEQKLAELKTILDGK